MDGIFISYRREDSAGFAGRLADALEQGLGSEQVFRDVDDILPGQDFVDAIETQLRALGVVLVLIGPQWSRSEHEGVRRLEDPDDFVRLEIRLALALGKPVIPVLVGGARMPAEAELPEDIRALARRQAFSLSDAGWKADVARLNEAIRPMLGGRRRAGPRQRALAWGLAASILAGLLAILMRVPWQAGTPHTPSPAQAPGIAPPPPDPRLPESTPAPGMDTPAPSLPKPPRAATLTPAPVEPRPATIRPEQPQSAGPSPTPTQPQPGVSPALDGRWTATIRYDWGDTHAEVFEFEVAAGEVFGSASYLKTRRAIQDGRISGNRLSFMTQSQEMLGGRDEIRTVTHRYRGTLDGDVIRFTLESGGGQSLHEPVQFEARRVAP